MLMRLFPFVALLKRYNLMVLRVDAVAGLTVALVLIPQSMAYAQLAGLPPYYGLYASFLPPMIAALFGSSRQLATGPVAVVSLMTAVALGPLATAGSEGYVTYAVLLALMVGTVQFLLGVLRLGIVVNFLSHPVVNGFTNAAAIIIASSQLSKLFGVDADSAEHYYETILQLVREALFYTHWPTFLMGTLAFAIMYVLKRLAPKLPNVLVAVALTTVLSWAIGFEHNAEGPVSAIDSSRATHLIEKFNTAIEAITPLAEKRTRATKALEEAKQGSDVIKVLEAERDTDILTLQIEVHKSDAAQWRKQLRRLLLTGVEQPDGTLRFYPSDEVPVGSKTDGRTWRLKVGNTPLKKNRILLTAGGEVIGVIPSGLPSFTMPKVDITAALHLLPFAAIISLLGFMEAISIAKAMAAKTGQRLDPNQELIGQGLANLCGAVGKSYPTSGSFSRSAVNLQSGAVTGFSSVFTSLAVVVVLLFFTRTLYHLPQPVLAAIIMMAVVGLVNVSGFVHAWRAKWYDGVISVITFVCTLGFAPHLDRGIIAGVALSLGVFLYKSMRPTIASLARYEDQSLRNCRIFGLKECEHIAMIRFDGPLFFANASYLEDKIMELMRSKAWLKHIILVSNGINDIDASGEETLSLLVDRVRSAGVDISMSGVNESVMEVLKRTFFREKIGEDHLYPTMEKAIHATYGATHSSGYEAICPLMSVCRVT
ncbi:MAG: SulP family inorganic anion transporter [Desulfobacterota bacterium]|nr:SulP family inorganic anion transporter [Thermodesulfobacteriota bacterium]